MTSLLPNFLYQGKVIAKMHWGILLRDAEMVGAKRIVTSVPCCAWCRRYTQSLFLPINLPEILTLSFMSTYQNWKRL